jgi:hypothetical protein
VLRKASERKIEVAGFSLCRYLIAFLWSDQAAMDREVTQRQAKLEAQGLFEHQEALTHGVSRTPERSGPAIGPRGESCPARQVCASGPRCLVAPVPRGMRCFGDSLPTPRRSAGDGAGAVPKPGRRLRTGVRAGAAAASPLPARKIEAELEKRLSGGHLRPVQLLCLRCEALEALHRGDAAKALELTAVAPPRTTSRFRALRSGTPAPSSALSIRSMCVAWFTPGWVATARRRLNFKKFSTIRESR